MTNAIKELRAVTAGRPAMDGDGVKIRRMIGTPELNVLDPFLLFDVFESDQAQDYIGGFPEHPHRGFETVTYLLAGKMRHKDNAGHEGVIEPGGVQWMTAGRGIVHSEMPEQEDGLLQGFQLWVNLPASEKMRAPGYQEFPAEKIAEQALAEGGKLRIIAGQSSEGARGPVVNPYVSPTYMDISLASQQRFEQRLRVSDNAFIYVIQGALRVGQSGQLLEEKQLGLLGPGAQVSIQAAQESRLLLVAAQPLNEPIARGGPFVMNTRAEILQAFEDFQNNRF